MRSKDCLPRSTWISLLLAPPVLPFLLPFAFAYASPVNITVDDASSLILYSPASSWHASSVPCSTCLAPSSSIAFRGTWHDGTHIIPTLDADDLPNQVEQSVPQPSNKAGDNHGGGGGKRKGEHQDGKHDEDDGDHGDKGRGKRRRRRRLRSRRQANALALRVLRRQDASNDPTSNPFFTPNFDNDDDGFVDQPVAAQLNFTGFTLTTAAIGSAVYIYALIPLGAAAANSTPTFMNLTFLVDSHPAGIYQHVGTASASGFLPSELVFGQTGLAEAPHSLTIQIGPDSVLLLDYIVYTQGTIDEQGNSSNTAAFSTSSAPEAQETGSGTGSTAPSDGPGTAKLSASQMKAHNIATFAGAVGGSVGLLAVLSLSLAISIYRRRLRAARRDRRLRGRQNRSDPDFDGESFHTDGSEDSPPPMQGPVPFVPRYFPGTVVPAPPPPYSPPADATTALLSSASPVSWAPPHHHAPGEDTSYADQPPPTPPPLPEDGIDDYFAPPPFPIAISSPIPAILAGYSPVATSSAPVSTSPVPLHTNGSSSRGVYATEPPSRSRANSDAQSHRSGYSDRPPSFASQAPPLVQPPQHDGQAQTDGNLSRNSEEAPHRISDAQRASVRSALSR